MSDYQMYLNGKWDDGIHGLNHYLHRKCVYLKFEG